MDRATLLKLSARPAPSNLAVYLKPGMPLEAARNAVLSTPPPAASCSSSPTASLRDEAIRIFDRTFAITYALEAVAVFVAVMGIAGALVALVIDRRRELGLLRFLGVRARQIRRIILVRSGPARICSPISPAWCSGVCSRCC